MARVNSTQVRTSVRSILFCRSATSRAMSSSDSLSPRSISCNDKTPQCSTPHLQRHHTASHNMQATSRKVYRSSTFFSFLFLELLDGLEQASVVGDAVHSGIFLILFGVHVPQQLNNINVLLFLWTLLLGRGPEGRQWYTLKWCWCKILSFFLMRRINPLR